MVSSDNLSTYGYTDNPDFPDVTYVNIYLCYSSNIRVIQTKQKQPPKKRLLYNLNK